MEQIVIGNDLNLEHALTLSETFSENNITTYIRCNSWSEGVWLKMSGFKKDEVLCGIGVACFEEDGKEEIELGFKQFNVTFDDMFKNRWSVKRNKIKFETSLNVENLKFRFFNSEHIKEIICDIDKLSYNDDKPEYANAVEFFKTLEKVNDLQQLKEKLEKYGD